MKKYLEKDRGLKRIMNKYNLISKMTSLTVYLPYSLIMNIKTLVDIVLKRDLRNEMKKNRKLRNLYNGKRCFIIGNGPSLKGQDLTLLEDEYTFVTNNFILHDEINEINPSFYCIVDPNMYTGKFPIERLRLMEEKLEQTTFFFRYRAKKYVSENRLFKEHLVHYIKNDSYLNDLYNFNMKLSGCIPGTVNVIHTCIMIAAYMGFNEIYLLGCDSTLFIPKPDHFYRMTDEEKNSNEDLDQKLFYSSYMFKSYKILKEIYERKGIRIINATQGGVLEVFNRVEYNDIVK